MGKNGAIQSARTFCPIQKRQDVTKMVEQIAGQFANRTE
jgi:hypothetical protein